MSRTRKPSKATDEEIKLFHKNTKSTISKTGLFFDPITGKYRKALKQDGKTKGSGRALIADMKYKNYLKEVKKRMGDDQHDDIVSRENKAKEMGFSKLQKERKLFGQAGAGAIAGEAVAIKKGLDEAKKAVGKTPTNIRGKGEPKQKPPPLPVKKMKTAGEDEDETPIAQTKLKKRGRPKGEPNPDGKDWYRQTQARVRQEAEKRKPGSGEEAIKQWRAVQKRKYGLPSTATRADVVKAHALSEERDKKINEQDFKQFDEESNKAQQREQRGMERGTNLRKKERKKEELEQQQQEDKIEEVNLDNDEYKDPLQEHGAEQQIDHKSVEVDAGGETKEQNPNVRGGNYNEEFMGSRRRGQEFNDDTASEAPTEAQDPIPVPQQEQQSNIKMEISDKEVEVEKSSGLGDALPAKSFVSPQAERVSMERNRMKYSPKKLYEECRAFVQIYSDDIKTSSFKQLKKEFEKVSPKTKVEDLRKLHRELEEEVIEYYQQRSGLRLGIIIDPSVLGININQLSGMMGSMPLATGGSVREIGTQQQKTNVKDIHYHDGGLERATGSRMAEGDNIDKNHQEARAVRARVSVPIRPPNRYLLKRSGKSKIPINLKIR